MKTLIINGHPGPKSFTTKVAQRLAQQIENSKVLHVAQLDFSPVFEGFGENRLLEPDVLMAQNLIKEADKIIITTPIWWSTYPALLKGFFDRVFLPGFAFKYTKGKALPEKLLQGKTAELYLFSDAPAWYRKFILRDPAAKVLKRDILGFCGIKVKKIIRLGSLNKLDASAKQRFLDSI